VFVHGIPTSPELWRHAVPLLDGARALAWEMPGYGRSWDVPPEVDISAAVRARERCAGLVLTNAIAYDSWPIAEVRAMRAAAPLIERLPRRIFRAQFSLLIRQGHDDAG
jgi:hypothetical protein